MIVTKRNLSAEEFKNPPNAHEMNQTQVVKLAVGLAAAGLAVFVFLALLYLYFQRCPTPKQASNGRERKKNVEQEEIAVGEEDLITFQGGEALTVCDILEAPGEVVGKSKYSTLYKAELPRVGSVKLLRFLRPVCSAPLEEVADAIEFLGSVRHPNLLPLLGFYAGRRGEKLLVYPFHSSGNLSDYLQDADSDSLLTWWVICRISIGITKGLDHLHRAAMQKPMIHGNLKSKNILLDQNNRQPYISDFGLYMLLKPASGLQMLEGQGYRAPEVTEIKNVTVESDIYSLGIIFLELITGKEPSYMGKAVLDQRISDLVAVNNNVTEEMVMQFLELAMACCSPSPSLRPNTSQVLRKLQQLSSKGL